MSRESSEELEHDRSDLTVLIDRIRAGDDLALSELFDKEFENRQYRACANKIRRDHLVEAWPLACALAVRDLKRGDQPPQFTNFNGWFHRIFKREAQRISIKETDYENHRRLTDDLDQELEAGLGPYPSIFDRAHLKYLAERIAREMSPKEGRAFVVYLTTGYKNKDLAGGLKVDPRAARTALSRAMRDAPDAAMRVLTTARLADRGAIRCPELKKLLAGQELPLPDDVWDEARSHTDSGCPRCRKTIRAWGPWSPLAKTQVFQKVAEVSGVPLDPDLDQLPGWSTSDGSSPHTPTTPSSVPPSGPVAPSIPAAPGMNALSKAASAVAHAVGNKVTAAVLTGGLAVSAAVAFAFLKDPDVQTSPAYSGPATTIDPAPSGTDSGPLGPPSATLSSPPSEEPRQDPTAPATVNGSAPPPGIGDTSSPPLTTPASPTIPPPATGTPPVVPEHPYTAPVDMSGSWSLVFNRTNFGGNSTEHDTIILTRLDGSRCVSAAPCWGGRWFNVDTKTCEAPEFIVTASRSASGEVNLSGTEVDNPQYGPQHYEGTAKSDTGPFNGPWTQHAPSDDNKNERTAMFTLTRQYDRSKQRG
jgi:DNA-directed RNA polymerase specialized sigma24 family protein